MNDSNDWEKFKKNVKPLKNSSIFFEKKEKVNVSFSKEVAEQTSSDFLGFSDGFSTEKMHIDKILFKKIKKGIIKPESTLDLHGKKFIEAEKSTYYFVIKNFNLKRRLILIITGKGKRMDVQFGWKGTGILNESMPKWLSSRELKSHILWFETAPPNMGGSGAFLVYLKKFRE